MVCSKSGILPGAPLSDSGTGDFSRSSSHYVCELSALFILGAALGTSRSGKTVLSTSDRRIGLHSSHQFLFQRRRIFCHCHLRRLSDAAPASRTPGASDAPHALHYRTASAAQCCDCSLSAAAGCLDTAPRQRRLRQFTVSLEHPAPGCPPALSDLQPLFHRHDFVQRPCSLRHALLSQKIDPVSRRRIRRDSGLPSAAVSDERHHVSRSESIHSPAAPAAPPVRLFLAAAPFPSDTAETHAAAVCIGTGVWVS